MSKWIRFRDISHRYPEFKTSVWEIITKDVPNEKIGTIRWYGHWRQYCFIPDENTAWNAECLNDVTAFIKEQMDLRKKSSVKPDSINEQPIGWMCADCGWTATSAEQMRPALWEVGERQVDLVCPNCGSEGNFVDEQMEPAHADLCVHPGCTELGGCEGGVCFNHFSAAPSVSTCIHGKTEPHRAGVHGLGMVQYDCPGPVPKVTND